VLAVPAELVEAVRDRSLAALRRGSGPLAGGRPSREAADLSRRCELAVRLALSYVVAPAGGSVAPLVRAAVEAEVTATTPTAEGR
jgi:hypothetical protein